MRAFFLDVIVPVIAATFIVSVICGGAIAYYLVVL